LKASHISKFAHCYFLAVKSRQNCPSQGLFASAVEERERAFIIEPLRTIEDKPQKNENKNGRKKKQQKAGKTREREKEREGE